MEALSEPIVAGQRRDSDQSCATCFVGRPVHDRRAGHSPRHAGRPSLGLVGAYPCAPTVSGNAPRVDRARGCAFSELEEEGVGL
jgi:hypothetical protein